MEFLACLLALAMLFVAFSILAMLVSAAMLANYNRAVGQKGRGIHMFLSMLLSPLRFVIREPFYHSKATLLQRIVFDIDKQR